MVSTGIGFKYQKSEPEPPLKILTRNLPNQTKIGTGFEPIQPGFSESENLESPPAREREFDPTAMRGEVQRT